MKLAEETVNCLTKPPVLECQTCRGLLTVGGDFGVRAV
jgi:hypothetical protein